MFGRLPIQRETYLWWSSQTQRQGIQQTAYQHVRPHDRAHLGQSGGYYKCLHKRRRKLIAAILWRSSETCMSKTRLWSRKEKGQKNFFKKFYHKRPHRIGEGDNTNQPISDTAWGILDGHSILPRQLTDTAISSPSLWQHQLPPDGGACILPHGVPQTK